MKWNFITIAIFAALSIYFIYEEYRKRKQIKMAFIIVLILEGLGIYLALLALLMSD